MNPRVFEVNFDGIVGPTHNYAGLAFGNRASMANRAAVSSPRAAALQGLAKMNLARSLGLRQAVLPPQERPHIPTLRRLGFTGSDERILARAAREAPELLAAVCSASAMWTANAATVSPAADTRDGRTHFTPANLASSFHRSLEADQTASVLRTIFAANECFVHHAPLPAPLGDEGAANHTRLAPDLGVAGIELFVHGDSGEHGDGAPRRFPARQALEASRAVARLHGLEEGRALFARQAGAAIDAGVFHNDVIAVGHRNLFLYHERAFAEDPADALRRAWEVLPGPDRELHLVCVPDARMNLEEAVASYFFNSQLISLPGEKAGMALVLPAESAESPRVRAVIDGLLTGEHPIRRAEFVNLQGSMRNGGGPACLRLRVELNENEIAHTAPGVFLDDGLAARLTDWIMRRYREELRPEDLADPDLLRESREALDELSSLLGLGSVYEFQRAGA